jgi:RNA exonuclease 4
MALYRLHRREWDKGFQPILAANSKTKTEDTSATETSQLTKKKKGPPAVVYPGGGRKGVSSGLSVVVKHGPPGSKQSRNVDGRKDTNKDQWWKQLS